MRVSHVAHPNDHRQKTHSFATGYHSPFYQGVALPSSPQQATTPSPLLIHSSFPTPSPVPILPHGCKGFPVTEQAPAAHLLSLAPSLSPEPYAVPISPTYNPHTQPRVIPNLDLGFGLPTVAESFPLPTVHPSLAYDPSYKECELTSLSFTKFDSHADHPRSSAASMAPIRPLLPGHTPFRTNHSKWVHRRRQCHSLT